MALRHKVKHAQVNCRTQRFFDAKSFRNRRHADGDSRTIGRWMFQYDSADKAADANLAGVNAGIGEQRRQYEQTGRISRPIGTSERARSTIARWKPGGYLMSGLYGRLWK